MSPIPAAPADRELRTVVSSIAPGVPIYYLSTMQQKIGSTLERSHFDTFVLSLCAAAALVRSSVGIYGVLSYIVAQRTRVSGFAWHGALAEVRSSAMFCGMARG